MENGSQHTSEPSLVSLVGGIMNDAKDLLVQEWTMTKLEVQEELRKAKTAAIALGIGIGVVAVGGMLLMLMLVQVLVAFTGIPLWECYGLVGSGLVVLGALLLAVGKHKAEKLDVVPQQTLETMKETAQWLTEQTTHSTKHKRHAVRYRDTRSAKREPNIESGPNSPSSGKRRRHLIAHDQ
jgi:Putative Actinobacterial Holin-X, holin superfamily III